MGKEKKTPYHKEGIELKIAIMRAGYDGYIELAADSKVSHYMLKDYACGKKLPTKDAKTAIYRALKIRGKKNQG